MSISGFIEKTVQLCVHEPDSVSVSETKDRGALVYQVRVAPNDVGRIIGKEGRVISSIRQVATAVGAKARTKVFVKVVTED